MNQIDKLLAEWHTLTPEDEKEFSKKIASDYADMSDEDKTKFEDEFYAGSVNAGAEAEELIELLTVRNQLDAILPYVSISSIAKEYFGKSRQWLYQRINNSKVNGKPAQFNKDEIRILSKALNEIGKKFQETSISLINT
ncbi:MAG: DUF5053 domain-containing protein [Prevotella sp.]|jgi:hypothetical protein|nr:DUF5053 domain-containing protein [Prevotella sp.]